MRIDMLPRVAGLATAAVLFVSLSGCARSEPGGETVPQTSPAPSSSEVTSPAPATPSTSSVPTAAAQTVVVERTGGIAGLQDTITVQPDGHWSRGSKRGSPGTGQLTADQRDRLRALATSPKLRDEATRKRSTAFVCSDAFLYTVTVGSLKVSYEDCGGNNTPETASQIVNLVMSASGVR
jgi:hypothetical protein